MNLILEEGGHNVNLDIKDSEGKSAWEVGFQQPHYAVVYKLQNYLERIGLYGNQEAYAGAANAILVVAALLATVTVNAWSLNTVAESTLFWVFSSLSFLFAISKLLAGGGAALPSKALSFYLHLRMVGLLASYDLKLLAFTFELQIFAMGLLTFLTFFFYQELLYFVPGIHMISFGLASLQYIVSSDNVLI
jgi:hypothetical protein